MHIKNLSSSFETLETESFSSRPFSPDEACFWFELLYRKQTSLCWPAGEPAADSELNGETAEFYMSRSTSGSVTRRKTAGLPQPLRRPCWLLPVEIPDWQDVEGVELNWGTLHKRSFRTSAVSFQNKPLQNQNPEETLRKSPECLALCIKV